MTDTNRITRRTVVQVASGTVGASILAGCLDESDVDDGTAPNDEDDDSTEDETISSDGNDTESDEDVSTDDDHETTDLIDAIKPGTRIVLYGETAGWEGESPESIMGTSNPTLVLIEGENYTIGWNEGDGATHNLEIRDAEGNVGYGLKTDQSSEGGDDQFLEFTANAAMDQYVCRPHQTTMVGDIQIK